MSGFGALFKQRRLEHQLSVEEVHKRLLISMRNIENLEAENWAELPDDVFVKGYVKRYARLLQLNGDDMWNMALSSREGTSESMSVVQDSGVDSGSEELEVAPVVIEVDIKGMEGASAPSISTDVGEVENVKAAASDELTEAFLEPKTENPVVTPRTKRGSRVTSTKTATELARERAALQRANGQLTLTNNVSILPKVVNSVQLRPILTTPTAEPSATSNEEIQQSSYNASPEVFPEVVNAAAEASERDERGGKTLGTTQPGSPETPMNTLVAAEVKPLSTPTPMRTNPMPQQNAQPKSSAPQSKYTVRIKFLLILIAICMVLMCFFFSIVIYQQLFVK